MYIATVNERYYSGKRLGNRPVSGIFTTLQLSGNNVSKTSTCTSKHVVHVSQTVAVSRALGLPTRSVTNFMSAHDTDESATIDTFWTEDGEKDAYRTSDSVW